MLLLLACAPSPVAYVKDTDAGGTPGVDGYTGPRASRCTATPALPDTITKLRAGPDGVLWVLDSAGVLWRYVDDSAEGCALSGGAVFGTESTDAVTDLALSADGTVFVDVFFSDLTRLDADGAPVWTCAHPSGHTITVADDGATAWAWGLGDTSAQRLDLADGCTLGDARSFTVDLGTVGLVVPAGLAASAFDPTGDDPLGYVLDLGNGAPSVNLGRADASTRQPIGIADLAATTDGYWLVEPYGGLFAVGADGQVTHENAAVDLLVGADDGAGLLSLAYVAGGTSYLAADTLDADSIWAVGL